MITTEELYSSLFAQGLACFEAAKPPADLFTVILKNENLDELVRFAKTNNIKSVFYNYVYYNRDIFLISEEQMKKVPKEVRSLIASQIEDYNRGIESLDFSRVLGLNIFCIYEGQAICVRSFDTWHQEHGMVTSEQKLKQLVEDNKTVIEQIQNKKRKDDEMLLKELRKYILDDPQFKKSSFPGARRDYIRAIFVQRKDTQKYRHLLFDEEDKSYVSMQKAVDFIETLWHEEGAKE